MARPLPASPIHTRPFSSMPMSLFFVVIAVFSMFSVITFLCGSRNIKKFQIEKEVASKSKENRLISKLNSNLSNRALSMVKLLSWRKVQAEEEGEEGEDDDDDGEYSDEGEEALWRKTILMGERCRPLDFSGNIVYDSEGNMLPDVSHQDVGHH